MRRHVPFSIPIAMERRCLTSSVFDTQGIHTATFGRLCLPLPRPTHMCYVTLLAHIAAIPQSTKKTENSYFLDCEVKSANTVNFNQVSQQWDLHNDGLCNIFVLGRPAIGFLPIMGFSIYSIPWLLEMIAILQCTCKSWLLFLTLDCGFSVVIYV